MINRTQQPEIKQIDSVDFVSPKNYVLSEHCQLFHMKEVANETVRLDLYFDAGKIRGKNSLAHFVNGILLSGTQDKTSKKINAEINNLGGFYNSGVSAENSYITIHCLRENLLPIFNTVLDAITHLAFNEKEIKEYLSDLHQNYKISSEKVSVLAQRAFQKELFKSDEKYASILSEEDILNVKIEDLKAFHKDHYLNGLNKIVIVGNIQEKDIQEIIHQCKNLIIQNEPKFAIDIKNNPGEINIEKKDAIQSAIRIGRTLINKKHEDYIDFLVLNTILGDYFGSRLMKNIREEKGYTYGIGSMIGELNHVGYFLVATEVNKDVQKQTIAEIKKEFLRLQNELVSKEELDLVRNYMLGQLLKSADGPYAMMDLFLSVESHQLPLDFYNDVIHHLQRISPQRILEIAKKYLNWEDFSIVIAG